MKKFLGLIFERYIIQKGKALNCNKKLINQTKPIIIPNELSNYSSYWTVYALVYFFSRFLNSRHLK